VRSFASWLVTAGIVVVLGAASPAAAAPPANDSFASAQQIRVPGSVTGSIAEATGELGEPRHAGRGPNHSVWFRFRARRTGRLTIDTGGSRFDTTLAAYTGSDLSSLRRIASDDDSSPSGELGSTIRFTARAGETYHIAVDSYSPQPQAVEFSLYVSDGSIRGKGIALEVEPGQTVSGVRDRGLRLVVSARRRSSVVIELRVTRRVARRLGVPSVVLGRLRGRIDYNQRRPGTVSLTPAARRALRGAGRLRATVQLAVLPTSAPNRFLRVPLRLPA